MFQCIGTINRKPFSIPLSASSSSEPDDDDEFDESFPKRGMIPRSKTLPRKLIVHTNSTKTNKRDTSKLINEITVSKEKHTIPSTVAWGVEYVVTYRVAYWL